MVNFKTSVLQEKKRCIICGEPPSNKNKEHVIPKWLIELTGDPKREWNLGVQTGHPDRKLRKYAADQFQFLACETCNGRYSDLEGRAKSYMSDLLAETISPPRPGMTSSTGSTRCASGCGWAI